MNATIDPRDVVETIKLPTTRSLEQVLATLTRAAKTCDELVVAARATWIAALQAPASEFDPALVTACSETLYFAQGRASGRWAGVEELRAAIQGY